MHSFEYSLEKPLRRLEVPSASVVLVVGLGDNIRMAPHGSGNEPDSHDSFIVGAGHLPLMAEHFGTRACMEITLPPCTAWQCFNGATTSFNGKPVALDALLGPEAGFLCEQLAEQPSWQSRFMVLEDFIARRLESCERAVRKEIRWAWQQIERSGGCIPVTALSHELCWSHRHFIHCFRNLTGLTPKAAARHVRTEHACRQLRNAGNDSLSIIAARCGYSDQAHLTREFREFAGCTPTLYREQCSQAMIEIVT